MSQSLKQLTIGWLGGIQLPEGARSFLITIMSRLAPWLIQHTMQCYWRFLLRVKQVECEANHLPPSSADVNM